MSFTVLAPTDFVVSSDSVTAPAWSSNTPTLATFFTAKDCESGEQFNVDTTTLLDEEQN